MTGEKSHTCSNCKKVFTSKCNLRQQMQVHSKNGYKKKSPEMVVDGIKLGVDYRGGRLTSLEASFA